MAPPDPQRAQALRERAADQIAWPHSYDAAESRAQAQRPSTWIDEDNVEGVGIDDSHIDEDPWPDCHGV